MVAVTHVHIKLKPGMIPPKLLGTFIDRVTLTCNLPAQMRADVIAQLKELEEDKKNNSAGTNTHIPFGNYQKAEWMPLKGPLVGPNGDKTGDTRLLVQCLPKDGYGNIKFIRCDWNPAQTEPHALAVALELLAPGLFDHLMQHATVTRFDLAVDVAYLPINLCLFTLPGSSISRTFGKSGKTMELGSKGSAKQFVVYDKIAQIKAKNKMKAPWAQQPVPKMPITRIELRLHPKGLRLWQVPSLPNPFASLSVSSWANLGWDSDTWRLFLIAAREVGTTIPLHAIKNRTVRAQFRQRLKQGNEGWWKPEVVWSRVPQLIADLTTTLDKMAA